MIQVDDPDRGPPKVWLEIDKNVHRRRVLIRAYEVGADGTKTMIVFGCDPFTARTLAVAIEQTAKQVQP
jgi:hypothetical protein